MTEAAPDPEATGPPVPEPANPGKCPGCGQPTQPTDEFCGHCGIELIASSVPAETPPNTDDPPLDPPRAEELKLLTLPKTPINVSTAGATHVGLVKENNEDTIFVTEVSYPVHKIAVHVMIVADGMGGEPAGEVFGQIAALETWLGIRWLLPFEEQQHGFSRLDFWRFLDGQFTNHLPAQIAAANSRILRYAKAKQLKAGQCGATIAVAVAICDLETGRVKIHGYNEGDARVGLVIDGKFQLLSTDQTISGYPFRFLGRHEHIGGNKFSWDVWMSEQQFQSFWVLAYSDGLWNMLSPEQITQAADSTADPKSLCDVLVATALTVREPHGRTLGDEKVTTGDDNISITTFYCQKETDR
ncbi:MAG: hypothetical protein A3B10_02765 [Candidatus Doudnabacteria bacterium RIFCSPLOWO2_01_FULL_44_21]|uniref:PPM-type phosphatase domain-containing protein n=1 Tax=Candidatus Doudnabacteria bacterium RIFCSPLOWO2_01_FULL_44_21 TaxID=1817841 RepID=A0A1F5Q1Z9_9BACT|nr:MAG: hypothetical protein A3B95_03035 [Candidatus Doudnabacteria bacterium RIFCSPHIGHO2_02_FULL_43_13b]OGE96209.1 MAG: hypothetical protein A3B10_02765 [Candidatus Doudnabacteria bacterium RIFCSPLOWO2_01_FULL_44_21]